VSSDQHGGGGGEESSEVVGGSGGEEFRTVGHGDGSVQNLVDMSFVDPRVSTILSNLRNHGELHVHFHFGGH
jgi:hypothetical protein